MTVERAENVLWEVLLTVDEMNDVMVGSDEKDTLAVDKELDE